jgi:hypothetical protein
VAPERFFLHPSASLELREATRWYSERAPEIAADFVDAIEAAEPVNENETMGIEV